MWKNWPKNQILFFPKNFEQFDFFSDFLDFKKKNSIFVSLFHYVALSIPAFLYVAVCTPGFGVPRRRARLLFFYYLFFEKKSCFLGISQKLLDIFSSCFAPLRRIFKTFFVRNVRKKLLQRISKGYFFSDFVDFLRSVVLGIWLYF